MTPYLLLLAGLLPLALGPLVARWAEDAQSTRALLDGFVAVALAGLVIFHVWPHAFLQAGPIALVGALAGLLLPFVFHRTLHRNEEGAFTWLLVIAFLGLTVHAVLDGVALFGPVAAEARQESVDTGAVGTPEAQQDSESPEPRHDEAHAHENAHADHVDHDHGDDHGHSDEGHGRADDFGDQSPSGEVEDRDHADDPDRDDHGHAHDGERQGPAMLAVAVILHRFPMALAVWWIVVPTLGRRLAILLLVSIGGATVLGFTAAGRFLEDMSSPAVALFEASIGGMLLHVLFGHETEHDPSASQRSRWLSATGALGGLALLLALQGIHPMERLVVGSLEPGAVFLGLALRVAPWLVLTVVVAAVLARLGAPTFLGPVPEGKTRRIRRALALGLPALALTWVLLGPTWLLVWWLGGALWVALLSLDLTGRARRRGGKPAVPTQSEPPARIGFRGRLDAVLPWLPVGMGVVALLEPVVHAGGLGRWALPAALALGLLAYQTPLAAVGTALLLLHKGWEPHLVTCFLWLGVVVLAARHLGGLRRRLTNLLLVAMLAALGVGVVASSAERGLLPPPDLASLLASGSWWGWGALAILAALILESLFRQGFRAFISPVVRFGDGHSHDH